MKLTTALIILGTLHLSANVHSQNSRINLNFKSGSLGEVLEAIENQSDYKIFYKTNQVNTLKQVSISEEDTTIALVLNDALNESKNSYRVMDKIIVLTAKSAQNDTKITGKITDASTGEAIIGASIAIEGKTTGVNSDANGSFSINVSSSDSALLISFIGYNTEKIALSGKTVLDIKLVPNIESLEEVVVVGYSTQKAATLTGSVSELKGKEFVKSPQPNISNSFAGRTSGIIANNRSGEPGYDGSTFYIRGKSTTGNNDVLIVVDGIPGQIGGFERLDPNDIASITVLKDASAAVYGSRAANGAILITTKRGTTGKPTISYSFNQGFSSPTRLPQVADAATYATITNEIAYYASKNGGFNQIYTEEEIQKFRDGSDPINYPNTNWQKETLKNVALQNQHNLSVSGGTEDVKYFVSLGTFYQDGIYKNGATKYNQYNVRSNIDANITKRLKVGVNLSGREENRVYPVSGAYSIFRNLYRSYPYVVATYPNGLLSTGIENNNPVAMVTDIGGIVENPTYILNGSLKGSYAIPFITGLSLEGMFSVDKSFNYSKRFSVPYILFDYDPNTDTYNSKTIGGSSKMATLEESQKNNSLQLTNIKLDYLRQFGKNSINAFVIFEQSEWKENELKANRINFPTPATPELSQGGSSATDINNSGYSKNSRRRSYIGKVAYNYAEKYLAEVQFRIDGSSTFPEENQYGFFPSVSAGWRISEENWFKNSIPFINNLKLRASYGVLGNDNVAQFQYYNNYGFLNYYVIGEDIHPGIELFKLANPNITWESATKTDIGFNMTFLKNLALEFIWFKQQRSEILAIRNASIPAVSGISNVYDQMFVMETTRNYVVLIPDENIGKVNNNGVEGTLGYSRQGDFSFNCAVNVTYAKNEIINIDEAPGTLEYQRQTGRPLNTYLLYNAIGIFKTEEDLENYVHLPNAQLGDLIYEDYNKDSVITADDMVRSKYSNIPQLTFGLTLGAVWKNIDLSVVFAGQAMVSNYVLAESGTIGNYYSAWADNRWSPNNPDGSYPRVDTRSSSSINGGLYPSTFWLDDASFIRLKNVSLGYSLPSRWTSRFKLAKVRIYLSAFNLLTFTKVKDYDPEGDQGSGHFYPQQKIYNLGLNVNF